MDIETLKQELYKLMSDYSQELLCAGWIAENEYHIWRELQEGTGDINLLKIRSLALQLNGFWVWNNDTNDPEFVTLEQWKEMYRLWDEKRSQLSLLLEEKARYG